MSKGDLQSLMDLVKPYSIIEAEIDDGSTAGLTSLRRIVHADTRDSELEQLALELQKPIVLHDAALGRIEYDRKFGWFAGQAEWCGHVVEVSLACARPENPTAVLEAATRLFAEQSQWNRRVREYAVEQLLPRRNDSWLDEDDTELLADEFLSKMSLESISVDEAVLSRSGTTTGASSGATRSKLAGTCRTGSRTRTFRGECGVGRHPTGSDPQADIARGEPWPLREGASSQP